MCGLCKQTSQAEKRERTGERRKDSYPINANWNAFLSSLSMSPFQACCSVVMGAGVREGHCWRKTEIQNEWREKECG